MEILGIFLLGFSATYLIDFLGLLSKVLEAKTILKITKINSQIGEWTNYDGFSDQYQSPLFDVYDDIEEEE